MIFRNITDAVKSNYNFFNNITNIFLNKSKSDLMLNIYDILIQSDMNVSTADKVICALKNKNIVTLIDLTNSLSDIL